jgi:hypothetical protein
LCHLERAKNVELLHRFSGVNYFNVLASKDLKGGASSAGSDLFDTTVKAA